MIIISFTLVYITNMDYVDINTIIEENIHTPLQNNKCGVQDRKIPGSDRRESKASEGSCKVTFINRHKHKTTTKEGSLGKGSFQIK